MEWVEAAEVVGEAEAVAVMVVGPREVLGFLPRCDIRRWFCGRQSCRGNADREHEPELEALLPGWPCRQVK